MDPPDVSIAARLNVFEKCARTLAQARPKPQAEREALSIAVSGLFPYSSGWIRTNIWVKKSGYQMLGGVVELSIH